MTGEGNDDAGMIVVEGVDRAGGGVEVMDGTTRLVDVVLTDVVDGVDDEDAVVRGRSGIVVEILGIITLGRGFLIGFNGPPTVTIIVVMSGGDGASRAGSTRDGSVGSSRFWRWSKL
jgi:hypothetical protein